MGASGWFYRVDHDDDPERALQALRRRVFEAGEYEKVWEQFPDMRGMLADEVEDAREYEPMIQALPPDTADRLRAGEEPRTIEEAMAWSMESGTHSILDIEHVETGPDADFAVVTPLTDAEASAVLPTVPPQSVDIEAHELALDSLVQQRWVGRYVVGHDGDTPNALFFFGNSGD